MAQGNDLGAALSKQAATDDKSGIVKLKQLAADLHAHKSNTSAPDLVFLLDDGLFEFCEAKLKLGAGRLIEAANCFVSTVGSVSRIRLKDAANQFLQEREARTIPQKEGERAKLSSRMGFG